MNETTTVPKPLIVSPQLEEPIRAELFSVERLEQHAETLAAAQAVLQTSDEGRPLLPRVLENGECFSNTTGKPRKRFRTSRRSRRRRNGSSITSTSLKNSSAKFVTICRQASTGNCRSLLRAPCRAIHASSELHGRSWRTPIVVSTRRCCAGS